MWEKLRRIWPKSIVAPHVPLGIEIEDALIILKSVSPEIMKEETDGELVYRVNSKAFRMAVYEVDKKVSSVWYDDSSGRHTPYGRKRKIKLYLNRYGDMGLWEKRMDNGWMTYYFNDVDNVAMVYGNDKDVIRINKNIGSEDANCDFVWKVNNIAAEIRNDSEYLMIGNYLELNQTLNVGEYGWTHSKLNIPDTWHVIEITKDSESIYINTEGHGKFILNSSNYGDLSSELLDVEDEQNSQELENVWTECAKYP